MIIKTRLKEVPEKGIGLIADENVIKGQIIYQDDPVFDKLIKGTELSQLSPVLKEFVKTYAAYSSKKDEYYLCCDNARFWNHSHSPNTKYLSDKGIVIALQDIEMGEELTSDYREFCDSCKNGDWGFEIAKT